MEVVTLTTIAKSTLGFLPTAFVASCIGVYVVYQVTTVVTATDLIQRTQELEVRVETEQEMLIELRQALPPENDHANDHVERTFEILWRVLQEDEIQLDNLRELRGRVISSIGSLPPIPSIN